MPNATDTSARITFMRTLASRLPVANRADRMTHPFEVSRRQVYQILLLAALTLLTPSPAAALRGQGTSKQESRTQNDLVEKSKAIQALLEAGKFDEAEPLVREGLRQEPQDIYFLVWLDVVLNGQRKYGDADELRDRIRKIWAKNYKDKWIAKGAPVSESSWPRMIATSRDCVIAGAEYFVPRLLEGTQGDPIALFAYYKVIARPKQGDGPVRIFQLDKGKAETSYFLEEYAKLTISMVAEYRTKPDIRRLVTDVVAYLDGKSK